VPRKEMTTMGECGGKNGVNYIWTQFFKKRSEDHKLSVRGGGPILSFHKKSERLYTTGSCMMETGGTSQNSSKTLSKKKNRPKTRTSGSPALRGGKVREDPSRWWVRVEDGGVLFNARDKFPGYRTALRGASAHPNPEKLLTRPVPFGEKSGPISVYEAGRKPEDSGTEKRVSSSKGGGGTTGKEVFEVGKLGEWNGRCPRGQSGLNKSITGMEHVFPARSMERG